MKLLLAFLSIMLYAFVTRANRQVTLTCGGDESSNITPPPPGPPGKRGPEGAKGGRGEKGAKGELGDSCVELKSKVATLEKQLKQLEKSRPPEDCVDVQKRSNRSKVYTVQPFREDYLKQLEVFCDQETDNGGWLIIQRRFDGSVVFHSRTWNDYKNGFGYKTGEYWLGLENIYEITNNSDISYKLRIDLEDFEDEHRYAEYGEFSVSDESSNFVLSVSSYSGTAGDSLSYHNGMMFSTKDRDNDLRDNGNCAGDGAWWYRNCYASNLNGEYLTGEVTSWSASSWLGFRGHKYSLKSTSMKIKPNN